MLKKLFVTAAAAAAVSIPLAGMAWAAPPSDAGSHGPGQPPPGQGGIPTKLGNAFTNDFTPNSNPNLGGVGPVTIGSAIKLAHETLPGVKPTPVLVGEFLTAFGTTHTSTVPGFNPQTTFGPTAPGLVTKALTPGCSKGHTGVTEPGASTCTP
jgi:hypothetical protein